MMPCCGMLLLVVAVLLPALCLCAPVAPEEAEVVYDQRQNGTENYRIHVDGVVIVHAPVESLLALGAASGASGSELENEQEFEQQLLELLTGTTAPSSSAVTTTSEKTTVPAGDAGDTTTEASTSQKPASLREEQAEENKHHIKMRPRLRLANFLMPLLRRL